MAVRKGKKKAKKPKRTPVRDVDQAWTQSPGEVLEALRVSEEKGLSVQEASRRRRRFGRNALKETPPKSGWLILANQFKSLLVGLLAVAAVLSFVLGEVLEGVAIVAVILVNAVMGFFTELRAVRSMEALRRLGRVKAKVLRGGGIREVSAESLVPGDLVVLEGGDIVSADLRLIEASKLQADESALTGESLPVDKGLEAVAAETPLAERRNMLFKGTAVTRGSGRGVVVATGMQTELGRISALVEEAEEEATPLEKRLDGLGRKLIWATLVIAVLVAAGGILAGKETFLMIETAIALAVAAIPEGLPIVATVALGRGMWRMARRNALVNRLSAVETLGATGVICTDKTGTLTENEMTVSRLVLETGVVDVDGSQGKGAFLRDGKAVDVRGDAALREALEIGALCNNASYSKKSGVGDPMEVALLAASAKGGLERDRLVEKTPEVREEAFDSDVKMMATFHKEGKGFRVAVKGAPESVIEACARVRTGTGEKEMDGKERRRWLERSERLAEEGHRVVALAGKGVKSAGAKPYKRLTLLGLVGLLDPPRPEVREAIDRCQASGIRVVMVTGDQAITAKKVALAVGLIDDPATEVFPGKELKSPGELSKTDRRRLIGAPIFSRVSPREKLDLIALHQGAGAVVAMTGDGVNDAPALKKADIGVAMGKRGTQVAREAADMVLKDDAFSTIVFAVAQGRVIYRNIRKFVLYLLSCNISEILTVAIASLANAPLPILPLQILFLNLVTDVFPALALGAGEGGSEVMERPPRDPKEPLLARRHWLAIGGYGLAITLSVLGAFALAQGWLKMAPGRAVSVSFLTMAFSQLWHVFNMRERGSGLFRNDITRNSYVWGALALCLVLILAAVFLPVVSVALKVVNPGPRGWALVLGMSLVPLAVGQILKSLPRR